MENPNRIRDLPAFSAVPERTAPPRAPKQSFSRLYFNLTTELYKTVIVLVLCGFETCCVFTVYYGGKWWAVVKTVMNLRVTEIVGNCLNSGAV